MLRAPLLAMGWALRPLRPVGRLLGRVFGGGRGRVLRVVVVVALAAGGYFIFIPQTYPVGNRLSGLVIEHAALSSVPKKAALAQPVAPSQSTFTATRKAAKRDPDETGMYAREWYVSSSGPPEVGLVLQLLPDAVTARSVFDAVVKEFKTTPTFTDETATDSQTFPVPGVAGAKGISWILDDSTTSAHAPVGTSYTVIYRVGRAVVSELIVSTSTTRDPASAVADTRAGMALLQRRLPGFSLAVTNWPLVSTIVWAAVTVAVAVLLVLAPEFLALRWRRRSELHRARELRRQREQYLVRGRRTVRRQRAPAWSQSRRR